MSLTQVKANIKSRHSIKCYSQANGSLEKCVCVCTVQLSKISNVNKNLCNLCALTETALFKQLTLH